MSYRIAITGSTGLVGSALVKTLSSQGHMVVPIVRQLTPEERTKVIFWDIERGEIDADSLEGLDAIIHLAGANIAARRWTKKYKMDILESRRKGTVFLSEVLAKLKNPPRVFLSASAVGYYGNAGPREIKDEKSPKGKSFLSDVCEFWEQATHPAEVVGIRVIHMRLGMVLSREGGALAKMLPIFKLGLGGPIGAGHQMISWIALDEIPQVVLHAIKCDGLSGAINFVSPAAVSNVEFTRTLGKILHRLTIFPVPSFGVKLLFGEMAEELLLGGAHAVPARLQETGYRFLFAQLEPALQHILKGS